jgi:ribosomal protein S12 methylthiotransferase accessory factor
MTAITGRKYKEVEPIETINRIRGIFKELNILPIEESWLHSLEGFYSVQVMISGTPLFANGKGTSCEYALASGYAELMERLQNHILFHATSFSPDVLDYKGFHFAPDEKSLPVEFFLNEESEITDSLTFRPKSSEEKKKRLEAWHDISVSAGKPKKEFLSIPMYSIKDDKLVYIPFEILRYIVGSNGMCAGNSAEEAIVQGLSEILERYVNCGIFNKKVIPPRIPESYLKQFPIPYSMLQRIRKSGNFNVVVKDCSFGNKFPVVGLFIVDMNLHTYYIRFGAHPVFEIAFERTMTELLQGRDINNMVGMIKFSFENKSTDTLLNILGIMRYGRGCYPVEFFDECASYEFKAFPDSAGKNNRQMMMELVSLLKENGYDILVRNVSFTGFPSFQVIVPGMSEIVSSDDDNIYQYAMRMKARKIMKEIGQARDNDLEYMIHFFEKAEYSNDDSLVELLKVPLNQSSAWHGIKKDHLISAAYYKMGKYRDAYNALDRYINEKDMNKKEIGMSYYKCTRDYIGGRAKGMDSERVEGILNNFYPVPIVKKVVSDMANPKEVFNYYSHLPCWECARCSEKEFCSYENVMAVYKKVKDCYADNPVDQLKCREIFM